MSRGIQYKGGHGTGSQYDFPKYEYDAVNDTFRNIETGKVFSEDGSAVIEPNHVVSIDAATYTEPVEVTPIPGNDAMAKVTVQLTNAKTSFAYAWKNGSNEYIYLNIAEATADPIKQMVIAADGSITISAFSGAIADYTRDSTKDITLW